METIVMAAQSTNPEDVVHGTSESTATMRVEGYECNPAECAFTGIINRVNDQLIANSNQVR